MRRILNLKDIVWDRELYPRINYNWQVAYDYSQSMKAGAKFPPIVVALHRRKYYLIDGKHRIEATKLCKEKHIQAVILKGLNDKRIFIEAVKANINHGYPLAPKEKRDIVLKLRDFNISATEISELIRVPIENMNKFVGDNLVNDLTGEVIVKAPLKNMAGMSFNINFEEQQKTVTGMSQEVILKSIITIIDGNMIDKSKGPLKYWKELKTKLRSVKL